MNRKSVGIVGYGFVGKAVAQLGEVYDLSIYDPFVADFSSDADRSAAYTSDFVFICVPTPTTESETPGESEILDTSIVEECAARWVWYNMKEHHPDANKESILVIKSTINVGTVDYLRNKHGFGRIVHNPEFLTQRTAMQDFREPVEVVVGGIDYINQEVINLYKGYYPFGDNEPLYYSVGAQEAELLKMSRNSFYALKVSYFNEIFELCSRLELNYSSFIDLFTLGGNHPWIAKQHTQVPGPDGKLGFGGACLPKDSEGLAALAERYGMKMPTLKAAVKSNKKRRK